MSKAAELANLIGNINAGGGGVSRNLLINGDMAVAQRGTSSTNVASDGYYTCDRWKYIDESTGGAVTLTQDSSVPTGSGLSKSFKVDVTTADTSVESAHSIRVQQRIEGQNLQGVAKGTSDAKPLVCSFYVKSNLTGQFNMYLEDTDNTRAIAGTYTISSANTWEFKTVRFPADTTGTFTNDVNMSLVLHFFLAAGSNFTTGSLANVWQSKTLANLAVGMSNNILSSTSNDWAMAGVQLEIGQNPTSFEHEPFRKTLEKCKRYYSDQFPPCGAGVTNGTTSVARINVPLEVEMRTAPTISMSGNINVYSGIQATYFNSLAQTWATPNKVEIDANTAATIQSNSGQGLAIYNETASSGTINVAKSESGGGLKFDAEL